MADLTSRWSAFLASGRARWCPGMRAITGGNVIVALLVEHLDGVPVEWAFLPEGDGLARAVTAYGSPGWAADVWSAAPDWTDPATLGCLLGLVRERWGNPRLSVVYCEAANPGQSEGWCVQPADNRLPIAGEDYESEAEALIAALEAAREERP